MAGINYSKISKSEIGGGRALLLLLLFFIAVYNFINIGYNAFVIVCIIPCIFLAGYVFLKYKMALFWTLFTINFFLMFINRHTNLPIPVSLINEVLELMLIGFALLDVSRYRFGDTDMILSSGLYGYGMVPRLFNRPEICVIDLVPEE